MKQITVKLQMVVALIASIAFAGPPAFALDLSQARDALLNGDVERLSAEFEQHQATFDAGQINRDAYMDPYYAFATTEPTMEATIQAWLDASPADVQPRSASAIAQVHRSSLMHGPHQPEHVPAVLRDKIEIIAEPAAHELTAILDASPGHLPSAYALDLLGAVARKPQLRTFAQGLLAEHDDPLPVLLAELRFVEFDTWPRDASKLCRERTKSIPDFTSGQCMAFAKVERGRFTSRGVSGMHSTLPSPPAEQIADLEGAKLAMRDPAAAFDIAVGSRNVSASQVMNLAYRLGPDKPLEKIVQPRLKYDPLNPEWLSVLGLIQFQKGRPSLAWQTIESSLELGAHDPYVRLARIKFMGANQDMRWNTTDELLDAFSATEGSMKLVTTFVNRIMSPPETLIYRADGSVNPNFECVQLLFVERFRDWCTQGVDASGKPPSHKCTGNSAVQMNALADRIRAGDTCGPATGWRERAAWLVERKK